MKKKIIVIIFLAFNSYQFAQSVTVLNTEKLSINEIEEALYPRFSKDDSKIIFSSSGYKGLYSYELASKNYSIISTQNGAGYNPLLIDNEKIFYRTFKINNGKKYHSINSYNLLSSKEEIIESDKRFIKLPSQVVNQEFYLLENYQPIKKAIKMKTISKTGSISRAVYVEDNNLILVEDNSPKIINPLGKGTYVWESLSLDGSKILFSFGNEGAYVCDLEGEILLNIEKAHYPKFSPDGNYISYMIDLDDGYNYISSDIFIYSLNEQKSYSITDTNDKIEMFAEWSYNGDKLVYNTIEGELFVSTLQIKN